jgi:hypothetical protein
LQPAGASRYHCSANGQSGSQCDQEEQSDRQGGEVGLVMYSAIGGVTKVRVKLLLRCA